MNAQRTIREIPPRHLDHPRIEYGVDLCSRLLVRDHGMEGQPQPRLHPEIQMITASATKRVLDPCCGGRMMWFDRAHADVVFGDQRSETITVSDRSHGRKDGTRTLEIRPDIQIDFRKLPFADSTFRLVAFDPPHLVSAGPRSWLRAKYGMLGQNWRTDLSQGFSECFRVLHPDGVLVFKWNETQVKLSEVLSLTPHAPLFGHTSGNKGYTHWLVFMKPSTLNQFPQ
jgi:SAM-dependent methyltransferase